MDLYTPARMNLTVEDVELAIKTDQLDALARIVSAVGGGLYLDGRHVLSNVDQLSRAEQLDALKGLARAPAEVARSRGWRLIRGGKE